MRASRIPPQPGLVPHAPRARVFLLPAATLTCLSLVSLIARSATFQGLGDLAGGAVSSVAYDVSNDGQVVVGSATTASGEQAFRWSPGTGMVSLGNLPNGSFQMSSATTVSADGLVIAGYGNPSGPTYSLTANRGYRWEESTGMVDFSSMAGTTVQDASVSRNGLVFVGRSNYQAFRWTQAGGLVLSLGTLADRPYSRAIAVSADGSVVVGSCFTNTNFSNERSYRWTQEGGLQSIGTVPNFETSDFPNAVSANGSVIVGTAYAGTNSTVYRWTHETGMVALGNAPGRARSHPQAVSADGTIIVGTAYNTAADFLAFIWDEAHGIRPLKDVLESDYGLDLTGWSLQQATEVTPDGRVIVGTGINPSGQTEAYRVILATAPTVTTHPSDRTVSVSGTASFTVGADGDVPMTFQWQRLAAGGSTWADLADDAAYTGATTTTLLVRALTTAQAGDQFRCVISNGAMPDATSQPATLIVAKGVATVVITGLDGVYDGSPKPVTVTTSPPGLGLTVTYGDAATPPAAAGIYTVVATVEDADYDGTSSATLAITPVISLEQTGSVAAEVCDPVRFSATVTGGPETTWQWQVLRPGADWVDLVDATDAAFTLPSVQAFHGGSYRVVATTGGARAVSDALTLTVSPVAGSAARLLNLSTRALCLTGDDVLVPGFVIAGTGTKQLLIRAVGPELTAFGLSAPLPDPHMVLKRLVDGVYVDHANNDDWGENGDAVAITEAAASVYAFGLVENSKSSALLLDLPAGQYTVIASDTGTATGIGIVELYDLDPSSPGTRLANISNRGYVGVGNDLMIPGFVVSSEGPKTFLIRAVGPTLGDFGVNAVLADPRIAVYHRPESGGDDVLILANDNWGENDDANQTASITAQVYAFALPPGSRDAAFVVTLMPGLYTVHASGVANTTGVALVEVYEVE